LFGQQLPSYFVIWAANASYFVVLGSNLPFIFRRFAVGTLPSYFVVLGSNCLYSFVWGRNCLHYFVVAGQQLPAYFFVLFWEATASYSFVCFWAATCLIFSFVLRQQIAFIFRGFWAATAFIFRFFWSSNCPHISALFGAATTFIIAFVRAATTSYLVVLGSNCISYLLFWVATAFILVVLCGSQNCLHISFFCFWVGSNCLQIRVWVATASDFVCFGRRTCLSYFVVLGGKTCPFILRLFWVATATQISVGVGSNCLHILVLVSKLLHIRVWAQAFIFRFLGGKMPYIRCSG
jgi:hypothetical protein